MAIRVSLHPNVLRKDGSKFARVVAPNRMSFESLLEYMVKDTALEKNDMRSVLQQFRSAVCTFLKLGYRVDTPIEDVHFSPGTLCKMGGSRVTFDKADPAQGLFFVNTDATKNPVRIATYSRTGSRYIDFLIPTDIPHGTYQLELRTLTRNGEPRTALYDRILEIG